MSEINLVFMGTPEFAVPSLAILLENPIFKVKAVYTQPDKPVGRKQVLTPPPVKVLAQAHDIPVFQPEKIRKNQEVFEHLTSLSPDFIVVVAYGKILPESILNIPKKGCVNVHGSLLEKYRGAAPIQWAIANGEAVTGITTMLMDKGMDTGDMLLKESVKIELTDTTETLSRKLAPIGAELLKKTLLELYEEKLVPIKQDEAEATYAPIITKNHGEIDWSNPATQIFNRVRAFTPWPSTFTYYEGQQFKIKECSILTGQPEKSYRPGQVAGLTKEGIIMATGNGLLLVTKVQLAGSKEMNAADFARGYHLEPGYVFSNVLMC